MEDAIKTLDAQNPNKLPLDFIIKTKCLNPKIWLQINTNNDVFEVELTKYPSNYKELMEAA